LSKVVTENFPDTPDPETINYIYDEAGWLKSVGGYVNIIKYNARGQKTFVEYGNQVTTSFAYFDQPGDTLKNFFLKNRTTTGPNVNFTNLQDLDYTYDNVGNVSSITDHFFTATRNLLRYDDLNRLKEAQGTFGGSNQAQTTCLYNYNSIGNILDKCGISYSYNDSNHPTAVTSTSNGKTYTYDANGNTFTSTDRNFVWTVDNKVASVTKGGSTTTMDYDYTGARVKKFGPFGLTTYPFSGYEIGSDGVKIKYIKVGNEILAAKKSNGDKLFYHNDHLGGINVITNLAAVRAQLTEYDPWGKISKQEGDADPGKRFTGQELDPETDLYYYGGRYYDQELGKFVSPDPFVPEPEEPQSLNRYSYVVNNPVNLIDPTGYSFWSVFFSIVKFLIGFGGGGDPLSSMAHIPPSVGGSAMGENFFDDGVVSESVVNGLRANNVAFYQAPSVEVQADMNLRRYSWPLETFHYNPTQTPLTQDRIGTDGSVTSVPSGSGARPVPTGASAPSEAPFTGIGSTISSQLQGTGSASNSGKIQGFRQAPHSIVVFSVGDFDIDVLDILSFGGAATIKEVFSTGIKAGEKVVGDVIRGFSKHGINQAISREGVGVSSRAMLDAVRNPERIVERSGGITEYVGNAARVRINPQGDVVTVIPRNSQGFRIPRGE